MKKAEFVKLVKRAEHLAAGLGSRGHGFLLGACFAYSIVAIKELHATGDEGWQKLGDWASARPGQPVEKAAENDLTI